MFLKYRPARLQDLPECRDCIRDDFAYDGDAKDALVELWHELLEQGAGYAAVIEDLNEAEGRRIVWFCFKVFIDCDYAMYLKTESPPIIGRQVLARWLKGTSPLLNRRAIERANGTHGLTMLVLNSGAPARMLNPDVLIHLSNQIVDFVLYFVAGYRCREFLIEYYDDFSCLWAEGAGLSLRTDYASYYRVHGLPLPDQRAHLFGSTPAEASRRAGTVASAMLEFREPFLQFNRKEQELLLHALLGATDDEVSHELSLALVTLRKRWDSIYQKIDQISPQLFAVYPERSSQKGRGSEKKRRLLQYLRYHLEELRPLERKAAIPCRSLETSQRLV